VALRMSINPLAMWLWISGPIFLLGTVIALWPAPALERRTITSRKITPKSMTAGQEKAAISPSTTSSESKPLA
ncbi:MAG: hypothetical protein O2788_04420, partial [Chloroflexi bacterium]|nr:hypothetical protein [Chloroflexota bacterium]